MDIFLKHGAPEVILTDRGREFWNEVVSLFVNIFSMVKLTTLCGLLLMISIWY